MRPILGVHIGLATNGKPLKTPNYVQKGGECERKKPRILLFEYLLTRKMESSINTHLKINDLILTYTGFLTFALWLWPIVSSIKSLKILKPVVGSFFQLENIGRCYSFAFVIKSSCCSILKNTGIKKSGKSFAGNAITIVVVRGCALKLSFPRKEPSALVGLEGAAARLVMAANYQIGCDSLILVICTAQ